MNLISSAKASKISFLAHSNDLNEMAQMENQIDQYRNMKLNLSNDCQSKKLKCQELQQKLGQRRRGKQHGLVAE